MPVAGLFLALAFAPAAVALFGPPGRRLVLFLGGCLLVSLGALALLLRGSLHRMRRVALSLDEDTSTVDNAACLASDSGLVHAEATSKQAAAIEQVSSSLEEVTNLTRLHAETSKKADDLAGEMRAAASRGVNDIQAIGAAIETLAGSSDKISKTMESVNSIALQTSILAFNASIEASHAGVAGTGFAVVAEEVRQLAERTATAARITTEEISDVVNWISQCQILQGEVMRTLESISTRADNLAAVASEGDAAANEQANNIAQINAAVAHISHTIQESAAHSQMSSASAAELHNCCASLRAATATLLSELAVETPPGGAPPPHFRARPSRRGSVRGDRRLYHAGGSRPSMT